MSADAFIDTNVVIYLLGSDTAKADRAEALIKSGANVSVQVLNEVANVLRRKRGMTWAEVCEVLGLLRGLCRVHPLTVETHAKGLDIGERYSLSVYDSMILAAALLAGCDTLWSEDMRDGLHIDNQLRIRNPFDEQSEAA